MLAVAAVALVATLVGVGLEKRLGERATVAQDRLVGTLLWVLGPLVTFPSMARLELTAGVGIGLALAWVQLAAVLALGWWIARHLLRADRPTAGSVALGGAAGNTGYLGIPLVAALLGTDQLGEAIVFDIATTTAWSMTVGFAVGAAVGTKAGETPRERVRAFVSRNPVLWAAVAGLLAPDAVVPDALVDVSEVAAYALLPVGFLVLGVLLTAEAEHPDAAPLRSAVLLVVVLRLLVAPALYLLLVLPFAGVPDAYVLQSAMPCTIMSLVIAHTFGLRPRLAATSIAVTTALVVVVAVVGGLVT